MANYSILKSQVGLALAIGVKSGRKQEQNDGGDLIKAPFCNSKQLITPLIQLRLQLFMKGKSRLHLGNGGRSD